MNLNLLNRYFSAVANPRLLMGEFWDDFIVEDDKTSKAIAKTRYSSSYGAAILLLIIDIDDSMVLSAIENHKDGYSILGLAYRELNKQNPQKKQIDITDTQYIIKALKSYIEKETYIRNKKEHQRNILNTLHNLGIKKFDYHRKHLGDSFPYDDIINHLNSLVGSINQLLKEIVEHRNE